MTKIFVNPRQTSDGGYLTVLDELGRVIKFKLSGNLRVKTTHLSRLLKSGDLVLVEHKFEKKEKSAKFDRFVDKEKE